MLLNASLVLSRERVPLLASALTALNAAVATPPTSSIFFVMSEKLLLLFNSSIAALNAP